MLSVVMKCCCTHAIFVAGSNEISIDALSSQPTASGTRSTPLYVTTLLDIATGIHDTVVM